MGEATIPQVIELRWEGPFGWPGVDPPGQLVSLGDATVAATCGVYLWTVKYLEGFLIYAAGVTRRPFLSRFREHTRAYRNGIYTLFDIRSLKQGMRTEIWHGFWTKKRTMEKQGEYDRRREELCRVADEQLSAYRVFVASADPVPRLLERVEASIMSTLYAASDPVSAIPDRGMALAPRWPNEQPVLVRNVMAALLHALPQVLEV